jgi:hypothetical protein
MQDRPIAALFFVSDDEKTWKLGSSGRPVPEFSNPTPWADGVVHLTQCPVLPGQTYRYKFHHGPH